MIQTIQYDPIPWTREMADLRTNDTCQVKCIGARCNHAVGFQGTEERDRFLSSSPGWIWDDALKATCPVCSKRYQSKAK